MSNLTNCWFDLYTYYIAYVVQQYNVKPAMVNTVINNKCTAARRGIKSQSKSNEVIIIIL